MATPNRSDRLPDLFQQPSNPLTTTVGELAKRIDVSPRDVLDAALEIGVHVFWHDGRKFHTTSDLFTYLSTSLHIAPVPELEFDLTADQTERLAAEMGVDVEQLTSETADLAARRKFIVSDQTPPNVTADGRQQQSSNLKKALGMSSQNESNNLQKLLMDAAAEIAALDGTENDVFRRLMAELKTRSLATDETGSIQSPNTIDKPVRKFAPSDAAAPEESRVKGPGSRARTADG